MLSASADCLVTKVVFAALVISGNLAGAERLRVEVRETGGWSRPAYPCTLTLDRPSASRPLRFRLLDESSRPIVVQADGEELGKTTRWRLAFPLSLEPRQRRVLILEVGVDVTPSPKRRRGHVLETADGSLKVINAPYLTWTIPSRVGPCLQSLEFGGHEHLEGPTAKLVLKTRSGQSLSVGGPKAPAWKAVRRGPLAVTLLGRQTVLVGKSTPIVNRVELDFPVSRSWVRMDWQLDDPDDRIAEIRLEVDLNLDASTSAAPNLVDFGAGTWVYSRLRSGQVAVLEAERPGVGPPASAPAWRVSRGTAKALRPFVVSDPVGPVRAEGWVHLMDRKRCLALAVDGFGRERLESIQATAEGGIRVRRVFGSQKRAATHNKSLRCWLHFVGFPPQQSAATSPRHMQTPPAVRVLR
ncbi:MAG TPA: hypothetical protein DCE39_14610 [Planctomycetaceae bacterium]|nr:hypothetical protein [Planctomycetaceae bacterium]